MRLKTMVEKCDILVVGAGTAGMYLSWLLSKKGYSVVTIEKDEREKVGKRLDVIHFETDRIKNAGIPPFKVGDPDCIEIREQSTQVTTDFTTEVKIRALQTIVRLTPFLNRMYKVLESDGVKLVFSCKFLELVFDDGKIVGVLAEKNGKKIEYLARLVVDASGTGAAIRTSLPQDYGIETFKLDPSSVMYVLLQYIKWLNPEEKHPLPDTGYQYYLLWFGPCQIENGAILGIGQPGSYENARKAREEFLGKAHLPPYEIIKEEQGFTPYRRPPYTLVGDGLLCIGDAAAITYPFSGHGVTATWNLCMIAAEVIESTLKEDVYISKYRLWDINVTYFRDQGAKFASLLMQLSGILNFSAKEWDYVLKSGLLYKTGDEDEIPEPNKEYEEDMSLGEMLKFLVKLIGGMLKRQLSLKHVKKLLSANSLAGKIKKHYESFPEDPNEFNQWVMKADQLWKQKRVAIKKLETISIEYH
jgi:flavin-dependent dehydrogenase